MSKRDSVRTLGGYRLARTGKFQTHIAAEVGVSKVSVHQWISGEKRPGKAAREKLRAMYGIVESDWDEDYKSTVEAPATPEESEPDEADEALQMARALQRQVRREFDALKNEGHAWTPSERAAHIQKLSSSVNVLAKTTGQYELGRRIMSLPIWKKIEAEMFEALKPFPDAAAAVAARLEAFERAWLGKTG